MDDKLVTAIVIAAVLVLVFGSWALAWRARRRRHASTALPTPPADPGALRSEHRVLHVATTRADAPLERLALPGLAFRSAATLAVHDGGLALVLAGRAAPVFIPASRLLGAGRANWTIDRGSGGDRLVFVRWTVGEGAAAVEADTNLRGDDPGALLAAIESLLPAPAPTGESA